MHACAADDAISWLVIGCSLGRGAADRWSDLDLTMGVSDEDFDNPVTPQQVREWAFGAWCAVADLGKYLRRRSWWEALDRLAEARGQLWRLWAALLGVPNPQYGLTSILDFAPERVPAAMASAVSDLDPGRLLAAARSLASQLTALGEHLPPDLREAIPAAMGRYVTSDLADIAAAGQQA